jgi:hypothetical protein
MKKRNYSAMAKKVRMLENVIEAALLSDIKKEESSSLRDQMDAFQKILIHDIKPKRKTLRGLRVSA